LSCSAAAEMSWCGRDMCASACCHEDRKFCSASCCGDARVSTVQPWERAPRAGQCSADSSSPRSHLAAFGVRRRHLVGRPRLPVVPAGRGGTPPHTHFNNKLRSYASSNMRYGTPSCFWAGCFYPHRARSRARGPPDAGHNPHSGQGAADRGDPADEALRGVFVLSFSRVRHVWE
jgi:hypothetical protein